MPLLFISRRLKEIIPGLKEICEQEITRVTGSKELVMNYRRLSPELELVPALAVFGFVGSEAALVVESGRRQEAGASWLELMLPPKKQQ